MGWLHTWAGVVLGALLFAVFWTGTLCVFDKEIDRWMMPQTRLPLSVTEISFDEIVVATEKLQPDDTLLWQIVPPTNRAPATEVSFRGKNGDRITFYLDPLTNTVQPNAETLAGTSFIFPFHYSLHIGWKQVGYWLVGLAGMGMLVLLVSGVVIHRKVFTDFLTFRPDTKLPRSSLDLHNLTGVLALPFHFIMALSGLIIFIAIYFPTVISSVYNGDRAAFYKEAFGTYRAKGSGEPASQSLASLDDMVAEASRRWNGEPPQLVRVWHPNDADAYVEIRHSVKKSVSYKLDAVYFDGATGTVLHEHLSGPIVSAQRFIAGLHFIQFEHWALRWIYLVLGLSGCVMIATGYIYWLETRRKRHTALGLSGVRIVEGLTVGSVSGIIIATLIFFVANRLLPLGASFAGQDRAALEVWAFYLVWLTTFAHAWARPGRAWQEQCWAIAALAILAPVLNWATTGDHLIKTVFDGYWPVAGMDLLLLTGGTITAMTAWRLRQRGAMGASRAGRSALKAAE